MKPIVHSMEAWCQLTWRALVVCASANRRRDAPPVVRQRAAPAFRRDLRQCLDESAAEAIHEAGARGLPGETTAGVPIPSARLSVCAVSTQQFRPRPPSAFWPARHAAQQPATAVLRRGCGLPRRQRTDDQRSPLLWRMWRLTCHANMGSIFIGLTAGRYSTDTRSRAESPASDAVQPVIDLSIIAALQHRGRAMSSSSRLLAWIEPGSGQEFEAAFVSAAMASRRRPATRRCASPDEARQWVEGEAAALGVPVEWTDQSPRTARVD